MTKFLSLTTSFLLLNACTAPYPILPTQDYIPLGRAQKGDIEILSEHKYEKYRGRKIYRVFYPEGEYISTRMTKYRTAYRAAELCKTQNNTYAKIVKTWLNSGTKHPLYGYRVWWMDVVCQYYYEDKQTFTTEDLDKLRRSPDFSF